MLDILSLNILSLNIMVIPICSSSGKEFGHCRNIWWFYIHSTATCKEIFLIMIASWGKRIQILYMILNHKMKHSSHTIRKFSTYSSPFLIIYLFLYSTLYGSSTWRRSIREHWEISFLAKSWPYFLIVFSIGMVPQQIKFYTKTGPVGEDIKMKA